jgi:hypothetical protein
MSQVLKPSHEHKLMQAQWTLDVPSKRILKNVSWCICSKMISSNHFICFSIKCSKEGKHPNARGIGSLKPPSTTMSI